MSTPEERPGEAARDPLALLFDIRSFTGTLFLIFGVIVTIVGLTASDADIEKAAGINLSLILGIIMLVMGALSTGDPAPTRDDRGRAARAAAPPRPGGDPGAPRRGRTATPQASSRRTLTDSL